MSLSRNGICSGLEECLSAPILSVSSNFFVLTGALRFLVSYVYVRLLGGRLLCLARVWKNCSTTPSDGLTYIPVI